MAFKKRAVKTIRRYVTAKRSAKRRSHSSSGLTPMNVILAGAVYGAVRPMAAKVLPDMFSFGPVDSDNVIIGAAGWYGMKKGSGFTKALGTVALASEVGIVSARLSSGMMNSESTPSSDSNLY